MSKQNDNGSVEQTITRDNSGILCETDRSVCAHEFGMRYDSQVLICRHMEAIWVMQLVTAGGTCWLVSPRQPARASRASFGLLGDRS